VGSGGIWWGLVVGAFDSTRFRKLVGSVVESFDSTNFPKFPRVAAWWWKSVESLKIHCRDVGPAENDADDELDDATKAESAALAAADTTEIGVEEALALLGADDDDQGDGKEVYSPDPDVRLIRNVWARKGVMERVRGVKYIYVGIVCL